MKYRHYIGYIATKTERRRGGLRQEGSSIQIVTEFFIFRDDCIGGGRVPAVSSEKKKDAMVDDTLTP